MIMIGSETSTFILICFQFLLIFFIFDLFFGKNKSIERVLLNPLHSAERIFLETGCIYSNRQDYDSHKRHFQLKDGSWKDEKCKYCGGKGYSDEWLVKKCERCGQEELKYKRNFAVIPRFCKKCKMMMN